jgi:prepilin-type N-terminal cleavage/methylation domain-containing protein
MKTVRSMGSAPPAVDTLESQRGFALVELAIVLVIIGLIIGGILKGQELLASARLKSTLTGIDATRAASATFQDRYGGFPGDYFQGQAQLGAPSGVTWTSPRCNGGDQLCDGDGIIEGNGRTNETLLFWQHLTLANLIAGVEVAASVDDSIGAGLPSASIGGGVAVQYQAISGRNTHWLRLGTGAALTTGVATGLQANSIDSKVDDGRPGTGSVRVTTAACTDLGNYDPSGEQCLMYFELNRTGLPELFPGGAGLGVDRDYSSGQSFGGSSIGSSLAVGDRSTGGLADRGGADRDKVRGGKPSPKAERQAQGGIGPALDDGGS